VANVLLVGARVWVRTYMREYVRAYLLVYIDVYQYVDSDSINFKQVAIHNRTLLVTREPSAILAIIYSP